MRDFWVAEGQFFSKYDVIRNPTDREVAIQSRAGRASESWGEWRMRVQQAPAGITGDLGVCGFHHLLLSSQEAATPAQPEHSVMGKHREGKVP